MTIAWGWTHAQICPHGSSGNNDYLIKDLEEKVMNEQHDQFIAHCISCAGTNNLCLIPHRANGNMVGWIFACPECAPTLYDASLEFRVRKGAPTIVCLCGSTRFSEAYREANLEETLAGHIVLTIGCDMRADEELFAAKTDLEREQIKAMLDDLHKRKIDLCDEVLVLNVGGYVGNSTRSEIEYAKAHNKSIRWLETQMA